MKDRVGADDQERRLPLTDPLFPSVWPSGLLEVNWQPSNPCVTIDSMKRWEYAIAVEEVAGRWALWLQEDNRSEVKSENPLGSFDSDVSMLAHMSREGWELVTGARLHDGLPRLFFRRRLK